MQQVPKPGDRIKADYIDYIVLSAVRMSDKGIRFQGQPWSDNISIMAKRPRGKKVYSLVLYPSGVFSNPV